MNTEVGFEGQMSAAAMRATAETMFAQATEALAEYVALLKAAKDAMAAGETPVPPPAKDVRAELRNYSGALQTVMKERNKLDTLRHQTTGTVGGRTLDMDAARAEIGRRLACLRDGGAG